MWFCGEIKYSWAHEYLYYCSCLLKLESSCFLGNSYFKAVLWALHTWSLFCQLGTYKALILMVYEHLVLYRKHSKYKYAPVPPFLQIEEAWIRWSIWNPSPSVGLRNCLEAFLHTSLSPLISCPFLILRLSQASPVTVPQVCLADLRGRLFFSPSPLCLFLSVSFSIRQRLFSFLDMQ